MSRLDWVIECSDKPLYTTETICEIFHHAYDKRGPNDSFRVWLTEIKPKVGSPRLRRIREALTQRVWEDLC